jgi:hypothetical protein
MSYFLITANGDGEISVEQIHNIDKFLQEFADGEHGEHDFIDGRKPWPLDPCEWRGAMMLIRGEIVTPKPVQVVTKYEM